MWATILGTLGTSIANTVATRKANRINQRNYEEVRRYNSPAAQMSRFRQANLNPNLIYTQQNIAEHRPEWNPPLYDFSGLSNISSELSEYQNIRESKARVDNLSKLNEELTQRIIAETIANKYADEKERLSISQVREMVDSLHQATEKVKYEIENILPLEKLKYELEKNKFDWSQTSDLVNNVFRSKELDLALKRYKLDQYRTDIELSWQKKLNELLSNLPDFRNLKKVSFEEVIKNSFLGTLLDFLSSEDVHEASTKNGGSGSFK